MHQFNQFHLGQRTDLSGGAIVARLSIFRIALFLGGLLLLLERLENPRDPRQGVLLGLLGRLIGAATIQQSGGPLHVSGGSVEHQLEGGGGLELFRLRGRLIIQGLLLIGQIANFAGQLAR